MRKKLWIILALFLVIPVLLGTVSCAKKTVTKEEPAPVVTPAPAPPPPPPVEDEAAKAFDMAKSEFLRENIYFAFDKSILDDMAQATLKNKAEFLKTYPDVYTTIEGHCDERGTPEYNLALGERRAESAKSFLVDLGIEAYRISTVSYGEERPVCTEQTEDCWAKNRRDNFIIN
ncbi:MAG: peptidoglycan-associated lipoprotein Pal [Desulfobacterales bacterium]|jgi:peptidoglycan-associated lipoprotein